MKATGLKRDLQHLPQQVAEVDRIEELIGFAGLHERSFGDKRGSEIRVARVAGDHVFRHRPSRTDVPQGRLNDFDEPRGAFAAERAGQILLAGGNLRHCSRQERTAIHGALSAAGRRHIRYAGRLLGSLRLNAVARHAACVLHDVRDRRLNRRTDGGISQQLFRVQEKLLRREEIAHSALHAAIDVALDVLNAIDGEVIPIRAGFVPQEVIAERLVEAAILRVNAERPRGSERFAIDPPASRKPVFDRSRSARFRQLRRLGKPQIGLAADGRFEDKQRFAVATGAVVRLPIRHAVKPVSFDESVNHALNGFDQVFADFADELRGLCGETEALPEGVI